MAHERGQSEQAALNKGFIDPANSLGVVIKGFDGSNYPAVKVNADGSLPISVGDITIGNVGVKNIVGNLINPSTEENQTNGNQKTQIVGNDGTIDFIVNDKTVEDNCTIIPLGINGTFIGGTIDTLGYGSINYSYISDKPTANNGLYVEFSDDGTNWDKRIINTYDSSHINEVTDLAIRCHSRYARIGIINGNSAQTYVRLYTIVKKNNPAGDTMGVDHAPISGDDALLTKSVITGQTTAGGGGYVNVKVNPSGALTVDSTVTSSALPNGAATEASLIKLNSFSLPVFDAIVSTFNTTSDVYVYKTGGISGTTVATITVNYTDATKTVMTNVVRT